MRKRGLFGHTFASSSLQRCLFWGWLYRRCRRCRECTHSSRLPSRSSSKCIRWRRKTYILGSIRALAGPSKLQDWSGSTHQCRMNRNSRSTRFQRRSIDRRFSSDQGYPEWSERRVPSRVCCKVEQLPSLLPIHHHDCSRLLGFRRSRIQRSQRSRSERFQ